MLPDISILDFGVFGAGAFLGGGVGVALIEGFFHKPKERALTEKEQALAEKERALAEAAKADGRDELVKIWMLSNRKLLESNTRLERSAEKTQRAYERLQREMNETKHVMVSLVNIVDRFMPLLTQVTENQDDIQRLSAALTRAHSLNQ